VNQVSFLWEGSAGTTVSLGVDGQLSTGDAGAGSAQVPVAQGVHTARIQVDSTQANKGNNFGLIGATLKTAVSFTSSSQNFTLDDASSAITYTGWTSTTVSSAPVEAIRSGKFWHDTISYTSSSNAAASFTFTGQLLYIFGCTGPSFGTFQLSIDGSACGIYNATSAVNTYGTLLFVGQAGDGEHKVEVKNMEDGRLLALDYFVATSSGSEPAPAPSLYPVPNPSPVSPAPPAVFPGGQGQTSTGTEGGTSSSVIGGILGALFGVLLLFLLWRYRQFRKEGGEGSFFAALCGPSKGKPQTAGTGTNDFKLWPMVRFRPKYAT
ncbi:uncharacterized protein MKK02DRAFT_24973, partial [Dioszegia hungarica]